MAAEPLVSVIITTKNEAGNIATCLASVAAQGYSRIETIVVDNTSTDETKTIARQYTPYIFDKGPERSAQRNFGAGKAKGKYLLVLDADMSLTPDVVKQCVDLCERQGKIAVVVPEESYGEGYWAACKALERSFYLGVDWIEAARFFRKDAFCRLGGYDETITGPEDFDLPQRIKYEYGKSNIGRICAYIRHNEGRINLLKHLRKKWYYGLKLREYLVKVQNQKSVIKQSNIFTRYILFLQRPRLIFQQPHIFIGMVVLKTLEMGALASGTIRGLIS
jgi:glycosyltransferase involved in cell wall biosynthesis